MVKAEHKQAIISDSKGYYIIWNKSKNTDRKGYQPHLNFIPSLKTGN